MNKSAMISNLASRSFSFDYCYSIYFNTFFGYSSPRKAFRIFGCELSFFIVEECFDWLF